MGFLKHLGIKKVVNKVANFATHAGHQTKSIFDHVNQGATSLFDHGRIGQHKIFGAGSLGSQALSDISKTTNQVGSALGSAGAHLSRFANSGAVEAVLGTTPVGQSVQKLLSGTAAGLTAGRNLSKGVSQLTKQKNYSGSAGDVVKQVANNVRGLPAGLAVWKGGYH